MKKGILTLLVMLLMLAALVTIGSVAADGDEGAPFEIAAKSISTKENLVLNFKVSVPEGADLSTLSLLLWESVPEDGFTAESETAVSLALAGRESESGYYVFCYDGIEDKELGREVYVRACYRDGEETVYTETVRYSVAIYLYTMRQTAEGEFLSLLDSLIARGNAARDAALAAGDENVGPALDGMATVTLTDAHFADGSRTGRFLVGQEITAYADDEGTLFWKSGSTTLSDSASDTLTFTVTENASYRPLCYTEGLEFSISNGEATVTSYKGSSTSVVIPKSYNGDPVTSIGEDAFYGCTSLTSITIPGSVTSIGDGAFDGCSSLNSITIPCSVTSIGNGAFYGCSSLTSVAFGENSQLTSIGNSAFSGCSSLTSITIPESVTSIGDYAFYGCLSLVYNEYDNAYYLGNGSNPYLWLINAKSKNITSCSIHTATKHVCSDAFYGCSSLTSITVSEGNAVYYSSGNCVVETDSKTLVLGCMNSVIPTDGSITSIGTGAFGDCTSLTSITIPGSVTSIGTGAFRGCTSLTNITIPGSVSSIGNSAFYLCSSLESVAFGENSQLTSIGNSAFYLCSSLTSITIPDSVTSIDEDAFYGCTSLTNITIPCSVTSIGYRAFYGCTSLASVAFSENSQLTSIGNYAFWDCTSQNSITIPESVTSIGDGAFRDCTSLASVTFGENSQLTSIGNVAFAHCSILNSITIPESVTTIGNSAFYDCSSLTSITIPGSVTSIGENAFQGCSSLTSITIPESVTSIGVHAFYNCSSLVYNEYDNAYYLGNDSNPYLWLVNAKSKNITSCSIHTATKHVYFAAFSGCASLGVITIPESVTSIGNHAFNGCSSLESITFSDPSKWYRTTNSSYTNGTETDVGDPETNATYFTNSYAFYYWYKE